MSSAPSRPNNADNSTSTNDDCDLEGVIDGDVVDDFANLLAINVDAAFGSDDTDRRDVEDVDGLFVGCCCC